MKKKSIAVIGDPTSVMIFKAIGLEVFYEEQPKAIEKRIYSLADQGYGVIYITEEAASMATEAIDYYMNETFPAIILIPSHKGTQGLARQRLRNNIEKAVGTDILFKEG